MIDTGSDLSLMRAEQYIRLGLPKLTKKEIQFRGIGPQNNTTLGEFDTIIEIDNNTYPITICVISDTLMHYELIIGSNFLNNVEVNIKEGKISVVKPQINRLEENKLPEVYKIDYVNKIDEIDLSHVPNTEHQNAVKKLIDNYKPVKTQETKSENEHNIKR